MLPQTNPPPEALALGACIERKMGDRSAEGRSYHLAVAPTGLRTRPRPEVSRRGSLASERKARISLVPSLCARDWWVTAGAMLRAGREAAGLTVAAVARQLSSRRARSPRSRTATWPPFPAARLSADSSARPPAKPRHRRGAGRVPDAAAPAASEQSSLAPTPRPMGRAARRCESPPKSGPLGHPAGARGRRHRGRRCTNGAPASETGRRTPPSTNLHRRRLPSHPRSTPCLLPRREMRRPCFPTRWPPTTARRAWHPTARRRDRRLLRRRCPAHCRRTRPARRSS